MAQVTFTSSAQRDYQKLPRDAQEMINSLLDGLFPAHPFAPEFHTQKLKPPLHGYRVRAGHYRVLFEYKMDTITVYKIRHRKDVYK